MFFPWFIEDFGAPWLLGKGLGYVDCLWTCCSASKIICGPSYTGLQMLNYYVQINLMQLCLYWDIWLPLLVICYKYFNVYFDFLGCNWYRADRFSIRVLDSKIWRTMRRKDPIEGHLLKSIHHLLYGWRATLFLDKSASTTDEFPLIVQSNE